MFVCLIRTGCLGVLLLFAPIHKVASADLLVSNLSQPFKANTPIANPEYWAAQSFYTGIDMVQISTVMAIVGNGAGSPLVVAQLRSSDTNGEIDTSAGGLLMTFSSPDMTGATSVRTFLPDAEVTLSSAEKYWFILGSANAGTYDWSYADGPTTTGPGALFDYADSSDAGSSWSYRDSVDPYFIQVNGFAVPEPSGWCLAAALACGWASRVRRNHHRLQSVT